MSTVTVSPIRNDQDLEQALAEISTLLDSTEGTPDYDKLQVLSILVHDYEIHHHPIDPPDPIEAIRFRMEQQGLQSKDLESIFGSKSKVSEVMSRKRGLSLEMIRRAHEKLGIDASILIRSSRRQLKNSTDQTSGKVR